MSGGCKINGVTVSGTSPFFEDSMLVRLIRWGDTFLNVVPDILVTVGSTWILVEQILQCGLPWLHWQWHDWVWHSEKSNTGWFGWSMHCGI